METPESPRPGYRGATRSSYDTDPIRILVLALCRENSTAGRSELYRLAKQAILDDSDATAAAATRCGTNEVNKILDELESERRAAETEDESGTRGTQYTKTEKEEKPQRPTPKPSRRTASAARLEREHTTSIFSFDTYKIPGLEGGIRIFRIPLNKLDSIEKENAAAAFLVRQIKKGVPANAKPDSCAADHISLDEAKDMVDRSFECAETSA